MKPKRERLNRVLKNCSIKLNYKDYSELCTLLWITLNGATFDIKKTWSTDFLRDCEDIWRNENNVTKMIIANNPNIIDFNERMAKLTKELEDELGDIKLRNDPDIIPDDFNIDDEF